MADFNFYTRRGCHLCEITLEEVLSLLSGRASIEVRDIDTDDSWRELYDLRVPVLEHNGVVISDYPLDREALTSCLSKMPQNSAEIGILRR